MGIPTKWWLFSFSCGIGTLRCNNWYRRFQEGWNFMANWHSLACLEYIFSLALANGRTVKCCISCLWPSSDFKLLSLSDACRTFWATEKTALLKCRDKTIDAWTTVGWWTSRRSVVTLTTSIRIPKTWPTLAKSHVRLEILLGHRQIYVMAQQVQPDYSLNMRPLMKRFAPGSTAGRKIKHNLFWSRSPGEWPSPGQLTVDIRAWSGKIWSIFSFSKSIFIEDKNITDICPSSLPNFEWKKGSYLRWGVACQNTVGKSWQSCIHC